jgi:HEAT repeat protein
LTPLEDLLQQCTVKITVPGGWGTGFFVAPGLILTCAHVVREAQEQAIAIRWQQQENWAQAVVERSRSDDDLALLRVTMPMAANPPCVYLDEVVQSRDPLYLFGYPDQDFPNGCPVTVNCEGLTGDEPALIKFAMGQVRPGMSGSPLLNQRTRMICGMVKFTRDRSIDLGGGAIPTRVILEQFPELRLLQQEFHGGDKRWVNLITQPRTDFQPYLQAILANEDYREWQEVYTATIVEDRQRTPAQDNEIPSQRRFSSRLKLRAETVKPDQQEQGDLAPELPEWLEQWDVLAGLRNYATEHVVLIGKPGSGKSTSLERLLWEEAEKALQDPNARIPVLVKLRRCTRTIESLIRDFLLGHQVAVEIVQIEELLRQGRFLLLLDGLNELPKAFETEIANFRDRYRRTTPMIVSTRDLGGGGTLGIEKTLKMLPLAEPQMREFMRGYLGEEGDRLFQQLQGDRLRKFAETPLLLWMLCRVFAHNGKVPDNLGLAFREFVQLHDQELQADAPADSKDQWHKLLRHLAFVMMQGKTFVDPELSIPREEAEDCLTAYLRQEDRANPRECAERWLKDLLIYHLIQPVIQPNFEEHIEFRHQLLQEYYAAEYLLKLLPNLTNDPLKRDYLNSLKWTEPIALMLALVEEEKQALRVVEMAIEVDLRLGSRLAGDVKPDFQSKTVNQINKLEIPASFKVELLSKTKSMEAMPGLLGAIQHSDFSVRWAAATALGQINGQESVQVLLNASKDSAPFVRLASIAALGTIGNSAAIAALLKVLGNVTYDDFCLRSAYELGKLGHSIGIQRLSKALNHQDSSVIRKAISALQLLNTEASDLALIEALEHPNNYVRWQAVQALGELGNDVWIPNLLRVLDHEDSRSHKIVRLDKSVIDALGRIGSDKAIEALLSIAEHQNCLVRKKVLDLFGILRCKRAVPTLHKALKDEDLAIRSIAATSLGHIGDELAAPELLNALGNGIDATIARALGQIGSRDAVPTLLQMLIDTDYSTCRDASEALGKIGGEKTIVELLKLLKHPSYQTRRNAAKTLGLIGDKTAIPELIRMLEAQEEIVAQMIELVNSETSTQEHTETLEEQEEILVDTAVALVRLNCCIGTLVLTQKLECLIPYGYLWGYFSFYSSRDLEIESAIPVLLKALEHPIREEIYHSAATVLDQILRKTEQFSANLLPVVRETLRNADELSSTILISILRKIGANESIAEILTTLSHPHLRFRMKAASVLAELGNESGVPVLLEALENKELLIQIDAISALEKLGTETVISIFVNLLNTESYKEQREIIKALGRIGNPGALATLQKLELVSPNYEITMAIASIQNRCKFYNYEIF